MTALAEPLADAVEAALRASAALTAAMGGTARIYTVVPPNASLPYVVTGEDQILGDDTECAEGSEVFVTVHVWAKPNPPQVTGARAIGDVIRSVLTTALTITGHDVVEWQFESVNYNTDPDGSTHGRIVFRYLISEVVTS